MKTEDFLNKKEETKFEVNVGASILRLIELTNRNQVYLRSVLKRQLELKELLSGKTESEFDEKVNEKLFELETKIFDVSKESYHKLLDGILK